MAMICVIAWSFIPVIAKLGQLNIDSFQFLFWTNLLSTFAVGMTIRTKKIKFNEMIKKTNYKMTLLLGFLGCFFYYLCLYYGYSNGKISDVLVIQYLWPALISIFAAIFLKETINRYKALSILLGFIAAIIIFTKGSIFTIDLSNTTVLLIVFIGAISFALFSIISKIEIRHNISYNIFLYFFWATLFSWLALLMWSEFIIPDPESMVIIIINGMLINGLSYILWIYALSVEEASKIAPLVYISPVLSIIWAAIVFGDHITVTNIVAIALVIISGLLVLKEDKLSSRYPASSWKNSNRN
jgi:drug/metabolite transporter (DMT)-like permease